MGGILERLSSFNKFHRKFNFLLIFDTFPRTNAGNGQERLAGKGAATERLPFGNKNRKYEEMMERDMKPNQIKSNRKMGNSN